MHCAETLASHRRVVTRRFRHEGEWIEAPDATDDLDRLFPLVGQAWEDAGGVTYGKIGGADAMLMSYAALVAFAADWLSERNKADGVAAVR